jgi:hypothetical protein
MALYGVCKSNVLFLFNVTNARSPIFRSTGIDQQYGRKSMKSGQAD